MIKVSLSEVKADFSKYVNRAADGHERIVILSRGKPKAVLMSIEELERLQALEETVDQADTLFPQNQHLLELLRATPEDDKSPEWWADFEHELAENRLTFRVMD